MKSFSAQLNEMSDSIGKTIIQDGIDDFRSMFILPNGCLPERFRKYKIKDMGTDGEVKHHVSFSEILETLDTIEREESEQDLLNFEKRCKEIRLEEYERNAEDLQPVLVDNDRLYQNQMRFARAIGLLDN